MGEIRETSLPGVGVRQEFETAMGDRIAVVALRNGRRELALFDARDPDAAAAVVRLTAEDAHTLGHLLGAAHVSEAVVAVQQRIEGLAIEWLAITAASPVVNLTIADGQFRTKTGASIVAIIRGDVSLPAPEPNERLVQGDIAVAVGTPDGLDRLRALIEG